MEELVKELKARFNEPWMTQNAISTYGDVWVIRDALEKAGKADKDAVAEATAQGATTVVGGGDTALEEALFLTRFATTVHLIVRRDTFRASKIMVARATAHEKIRIHLNREVVEVVGETKTEALTLKDTRNGATERLAVGGLFVAIGHKPNTELLGGALPVDAAGYLTVKGHSSASAIDGVFIAGDVHDHRYRQAVTAAGDGCRAALDAERWLADHAV
mgnify:CR=1 FL=1